jgi:phosphoribosylformylglycinamidine (FGAM) synthase-like enzyme
VQSGHGAIVALRGRHRHSALLFGETTGRALVTFAVAEEAAVLRAAESAKVPIEVVGRVSGRRLSISIDGRIAIDEDVSELTGLWRSAFRRAIESADLL